MCGIGDVEGGMGAPFALLGAKGVFGKGSNGTLAYLLVGTAVCG